MFFVTQALFDFIAQNLLGLDNYMKNIFTQSLFLTKLQEVGILVSMIPGFSIRDSDLFQIVGANVRMLGIKML